jgi:hypothetical protein
MAGISSTVVFLHVIHPRQSTWLQGLEPDQQQPLEILTLCSSSHCHCCPSSYLLAKRCRPQLNAVVHTVHTSAHLISTSTYPYFLTSHPHTCASLAVSSWILKSRHRFGSSFPARSSMTRFAYLFFFLVLQCSRSTTCSAARYPSAASQSSTQLFRWKRQCVRACAR